MPDLYGRAVRKCVQHDTVAHLQLPHHLDDRRGLLQGRLGLYHYVAGLLGLVADYQSVRTELRRCCEGRLLLSLRNGIVCGVHHLLPVRDAHPSLRLCLWGNRNAGRTCHEPQPVPCQDLVGIFVVAGSVDSACGLDDGRDHAHFKRRLCPPRRILDHQTYHCQHLAVGIVRYGDCVAVLVSRRLCHSVCPHGRHWRDLH